jgi:hypothetical protein
MFGGSCVAQKQMCQISGRGIKQSCQGIVYRTDFNRISYNGQAIKLVNVAERLEAVTIKALLF